MALDTSDKLTEINTTLDESSSPYYTDMYNAWETKEQLQVWFEVAKPKTASGTIDTSDSTLTKLDNIYTLSVANPDWKIFSIGIDWMEKTFKIGFYNNTPLAYSDLETQLQTWLWYDYQVAYVSGTNYTISKTDWTTISKTSPNLVRTITLTWFDTISVIDVIVDWVTVTLNWPTHSWDASTAITYLSEQLSSTIYYMNNTSNVLEIARKDWAIPVITKTQYNKYTYQVIWYALENISSANAWWNWWANPIKSNIHSITIDWVTYTYTYPYVDWLQYGFNYTPVNLSWWVQATVNSFTNWQILLDIMYSWLWSGTYTKSSISTYPSATYFWFQFSLNRNDYSQITKTFSYEYVLQPDLTRYYTTYQNGFNIVETNHLADITVATLTEITITSTLSWYWIFIPVWFNPKKIQMTATSSVWSSTWTWTSDWQSCTTKYGTTTAFVTDKIFKTDASNYGNIITTRRWWFTITWTVNTSNKLDYICT